MKAAKIISKVQYKEYSSEEREGWSYADGVWHRHASLFYYDDIVAYLDAVGPKQVVEHLNVQIAPLERHADGWRMVRDFHVRYPAAMYARPEHFDKGTSAGDLLRSPGKAMLPNQVLAKQPSELGNTWKGVTFEEVMRELPKIEASLALYLTAKVALLRAAAMDEA